MPRIAFVDYFPTHYRRRLYEELARRADADFYFFADQRERWSDPNVPAAWNDGDYRRVELPRYRVAGQAIMPGVAGRLLRGRYDAVIKSPNGKLMLPLIYGAARASRTAFVLWLGMWMHPRSAAHRVSKPMLEGIYRGAGAIVAYGDHIKRFALQTPGVAAEKVFVAGQAVDSDPFEAVHPLRDTQPPEILFIGQFKEFKGLPDLIDAYERVSPSGAHLRLIGGGPMSDWACQRVRMLPGVELVGYRSQAELPAELARARCLVIPSITTALDREPWGVVVNEAMHSGVPVIATDAVGAAAGGLVVDGRNGLVVPERDPTALADAMLRLIRDPELATRMGEAARRDVAAFNYPRMAQAFLDAVQFAIAANARRRHKWTPAKRSGGAH
jgi:glycosyltransferase involved in cell wall biosynthesis